MKQYTIKPLHTGWFYMNWGNIMSPLAARASAAAPGTWTRSRTSKPVLVQAKACEGPAVVCVKSDRDANLLIAQDMFNRFFDVYHGPAA